MARTETALQTSEGSEETEFYFLNVDTGSGWFVTGIEAFNLEIEHLKFDGTINDIEIYRRII